MLNLTIILTYLSTSHNFIKKNINNMFKHTFSLKLSLLLSFTFQFKSNSLKIFVKNIK